MDWGRETTRHDGSVGGVDLLGWDSAPSHGRWNRNRCSSLPLKVDWSASLGLTSTLCRVDSNCECSPVLGDDRHSRRYLVFNWMGCPMGTTGRVTGGVTRGFMLDCPSWSLHGDDCLLSAAVATAVTSKALVASRLSLAGIPSLPTVAR